MLIPVLSHLGEQGKYQVARGIANREKLVNETDMEASIRESAHTFDVFAFTGRKIAFSQEAITHAMNHGSHFRIVIFDH